MSIRRMMLFTLGGFFKSIISLFKTRVLSDGGTFEAETNLENQLNTLGSDLFDSASLVITPNGVKTSKLYSIKPNDGNGDLTVSRKTTATRIDENGNIVNVPANMARIDYSNGSPAILVEPQRTNLVYPSDIATTQVRAVTATAHTLSFYGTGTVTLSGVATGTLAGTGSSNRVTLTFTPTAGNLTLTVNGSVTNWQLEAGSNATSLIRTISGSVTRNADTISKTGISNLIGQTEGTLFADIYLNSISDVYRRAISVSNGTFDSRILIAINSNGVFEVYITNSGVNQFIFYGNPSSIALIGRNKVALAYKNNDVVFYLNGVLIASTNIATIPSCSNFYLGKVETSSASGIMNGKFNNAMLFKTKLSTSELISLTTL